jgi:hypothetical protein
MRTPCPRLSQPQATGWALCSLGRVLARSCALSAVSVWRAALLQRTDNAVRPPWRAWCDEAQATRGAHCQALVGADGVRPLRRGGVGHGQGPPRAVARAATTWGLRFTGLAVRGGARGGASPVAWTLWPANQPAAWRGHGRHRRRRRRPALSTGPTLIVWADRGLAAPWRWRRLVRLGWPPCRRLHRGGPFRPALPAGRGGARGASQA